MDVVYLFATYQGRLAYALMSVYAVCPEKIDQYIPYNVSGILFGNMLCGIGVMIFGRPSLAMVRLFYRLPFSIGGSLMFNHASMTYFEWIHETCQDSTFIAMVLSYIGGRVFMIHLLSFLYHVDTRTFHFGYNRPKRNQIYEHMYIL
ncbi:hypothetical protein WA026_015099 [Henosepilachna vigintioctopunctata]|uniref:Uncharacterized protein n=1 Tax=Henosepilachna vigintioctopunctata TaxID=420089 RepID=A0AAW1TZ53_9CUCU